MALKGMETELTVIAKKFEVPFFEEPVNVIVPEQLSVSDTEKITMLVTDMLTSGDYAVDYLVRETEAALEKHLDLKERRLFLLSHGRIALLLALEVLGVGNGGERDEVICPSFAYQAVLDVIRIRRLKPVFADVDTDMMNCTAESIVSKITARTSAVILVDNYGLPNDYDVIIKKVKNVDETIKVIIDSAESYGATYKNRQIGACGDAVALSFSFSKPLQCGKGGGLIVSDLLAENMMRNKALERSVWFKGCQLDPFKALALKLSLKNVNKNVAHRDKIAAVYRERLGNLPGIYFQTIPTWATSAHTHFPVIIDENRFGMDRQMLKSLLGMQNVQTKEYFTAQHLNVKGTCSDLLPNSMHLSEKVLALPIGSGISFATANAVVDLIHMFHDHAKVYLCLGLTKWITNAVNLLENQEVDEGVKLYEMIIRVCVYYNSNTWIDFYTELLQKIRDVSSERIKKEFVETIRNSEEKRALACNDKNDDNILTSLIAGCCLRRLALKYLENGEYKNAIGMYSEIAEKYKRAGYDEMAECYLTIRKGIERCSSVRMVAESSIFKDDKSKNVLILGANGFVGRNVIAKIKGSGYCSVVGIGLTSVNRYIKNDWSGLGREINADVDGEIEFYEMDIRDTVQLEAILRDNDFRTIINLLPFSEIRFFEIEPAFNIASMLGDGFTKIVEYASKKHARLIQMSTAELYRSTDTEEKNETGEVNSFQNMYTEGKRLMELLSELSGIDVVTFRSANIYGDGDQSKRVIPNLIARAKDCKVLHTNNELMSFIHVSDVVAAIEMAIRRELSSGIYNLGTGEPVMIRTVAEIIRENVVKMRKSGRSHIVCPDIKGRAKIMDCSKITTKSNWRAEVSLEEGLKKKIGDRF